VNKIKNCIRSLSITLIGFAILLLTMDVCSAQTTASDLPPNADAPDLQVIVMGGLPGGDAVCVTYPGVATQVQQHADVSSLCSQLNADASKVHTSTASLPEAGGHSPLLTSITLTAQGVALLNTGRLPVDKLIVALRSYHKLAITYILPPQFHYTGIHRYSNQYVDLALTQSGSTLIFAVTIKDPNFESLILPDHDIVVSSVSKEELMRQKTDKLLLGIGAAIFVVLVATLGGFLVYRALTKLQKGHVQD